MNCAVRQTLQDWQFRARGDTAKTLLFATAFLVVMPLPCVATNPGQEQVTRDFQKTLTLTAGQRASPSASKTNSEKCAFTANLAAN